MLRKLLLVLLDAVLISVALYIALVLRFEQAWGLDFSITFKRLPIILSAYLMAMMLGGMYDVLWKYAGVNEVFRMSFLIGIVCGSLLILSRVLVWNVSLAVLTTMAILVLALVFGSRILGRVLMRMGFAQKLMRNESGPVPPRMMIVGAGAAGAFVLQMCKNDPAFGQPLLFVDDDPAKQRQRIQGIAVRGTAEDIPALAEQFDIQDIIIAIPSLKGKPLNDLIAKCRETPCRVRVSGQMQSSDRACAPETLYIREANISDFLSREEISLDTAEIAAYLSGKTILVTGGGGSIGSELCRQIMRFSPKLLVVFDIYENCAYELECELKQEHGKDCPLLVLIGSVRDERRLREVFEQVRPEVVFHAAAHKHVPLMEDSPAEAVKNNVFGTLNVLKAADAANVQRFVLLSTDKAVNPTNVMGASKRVTEMVIQNYAKKTEMRCMAVRFGNVLGSHGSVIPLFERQIKSGGPVTVTHPDIIRYFMTIPEAAQLVLQAGTIARSGSIFVLDMGEPVRIYDLAAQLIRFYGYEPNVDMHIVITGLRPGEKLYEELMTHDERSAMERTEHDRIMIAPPIPQDADCFEKQLQVLEAAADHNDARVVAVLHEIVASFHPADDLRQAKVG